MSASTIAKGMKVKVAGKVRTITNVVRAKGFVILWAKVKDGATGKMVARYFILSNSATVTAK